MFPCMAGWTGPQNPTTQTIQSVQVNTVVIMGAYTTSRTIAQVQEMRTQPAKYQATYFNPDRGKEWPEACTCTICPEV